MHRRLQRGIRVHFGRNWNFPSKKFKHVRNTISGLIVKVQFSTGTCFCRNSSRRTREDSNRSSDVSATINATRRPLAIARAVSFYHRPTQSGRDREIARHEQSETHAFVSCQKVSQSLLSQLVNYLDFSSWPLISRIDRRKIVGNKHTTHARTARTVL